VKEKETGKEKETEMEKETKKEKEKETYLDAIVQPDNVWVLHLPAYPRLPLQLLEVCATENNIRNEDNNDKSKKW
jgi:hypothetical protein